MPSVEEELTSLSSFSSCFSSFAMSAVFNVFLCQLMFRTGCGNGLC